ncbi:bacterial proteasome activator family protein [Kribbia dieselivorans]|uniref:bacterial proteasome activator family protein n=1 Tax=Kribbia dieselivorans TaxID=331526 RepID=UPI0009FB4CDF|nr:bacterial proteasome activator family protein [Kribbia dieselivorans]
MSDETTPAHAFPPVPSPESDTEVEHPLNADPTTTPEVPDTETPAGERVVVLTPQGMGVASTDPNADGTESTNPADLIEQPAKVMRIGTMVKQLLEEVRSAPLDEAGRARLAGIHDTALAELKDGLAPELDAELDRLSKPFRDSAPSDAELRIAQAQLVGWLEGLFHGIQTALVAQQMAAQTQLQQMRALPGGAPRAGHPNPGEHVNPNLPPNPMARHEGTGQYL